MNQDLSTFTNSQDQLHQALLDAGAEYKNRKYFCPFHDDKSTPNGAVYEKDGKWYYKCFSCGAAGDYFDIVARAQNRPVEHVIAETLKGDNPPPPPPKAAPKPAKKGRPFDSLDDVIAWAERTLDGKCTKRHKYSCPDTRETELVTLRIDKHAGGKEFRQCYPAPDGGWHLGYNTEIPRPLYNRTRVQQASTVLFVEGEKCVHALQDIGIVATCAPGGANTDMGKVGFQPLAGKTVVLWPDNDAPDEHGKIAGQAYIKAAMAQINTLQPPASTRTIDPAPLNLPVKGDAADFIDRERAAGTPDMEIKRRILQLCEGSTPQGPGAEVIELIEDIITGKHKPIDWLFPQLSRQTNALLPGTVTIISGTPGSSKSWFALQNAMHFFDQGESVAILMMEESRRYWLRRAMVIKAQNSLHLDAGWMRAHGQDARAMASHHLNWMDKFGRCIEVTSSLYTTLPQVLDWINKQAQLRTRIIIVDPITLAVVDGNQRQDIEELKFLSAIKQDIEASASSVILVTHPKQGALPIGMNAMAGGAAYQRTAQTILWMEHLDEDMEFVVKRLKKPPFGAPTPEEVTVHCNRRLWLLKTRNSSGHGLKIAYHFDGETVSFSEQGLICNSMHKNKAGA